MIEFTESTGNGLVLTFEPPSVQQMRLWAKFGERAANANDMEVLRAAYAGYSWECRIVENLAHIHALCNQGNETYVVSWLNCIAFELRCAIGDWIQVVSAFQEHAIPGERWAKEAARHVDQLNQFFMRVYSYALALCAQYGFEVPSNLHEAYAALFQNEGPEQTSSLLEQ